MVVIFGAGQDKGDWEGEDAINTQDGVQGDRINQESESTRQRNSISTTIASEPASSLGSELAPELVSRGGITGSPPRPDNAATSLKDMRLVRVLVGTFFRDIAPLRSFGFIHEPSFMQRLDAIVHSSSPDPLLLAICALATKTKEHTALRDIGTGWARTALQIVFSHIGRIEIQSLMAIVLLHEHSARTEEMGLCFLLSSLACRFCQALQLNVEYDLDFSCETSALSTTDKETRRRLMWACYCIDISTACGVEQLKLLREEDVRIQLPAHEESFFYRTANSAGFLAPPGMLMSASATDNSTQQGHRALYVQLAICRDRTLRYLKRTHQEEHPSDPTSEFNKLAADLDTWAASLPTDLRLSSEVLYVRRGQGMLAALFALHILYHQCCCDLYRCLVPDLQMPPRSFHGMNTAPLDFLGSGRLRWYNHACRLSDIFKMALDHSWDSLAEPETSISAYTAVRGKLYYLCHFMTAEERNIQSHRINELISVDIKYLQQLRSLHPSITRTLDATIEMVRTLDARAGGVVPTDSAGVHESNGTGTNLPLSFPQVSADYLLHPLANFRLTRLGIMEKHVPEKVYNMGTTISPDVNLPLYENTPFLHGSRDMDEDWLSLVSGAGRRNTMDSRWTGFTGMAFE
ncbi:hypothetical protein N7510_005426 [Penicillium lagena]|uniref:uncharacterized protein n=1 Tax=Penicillium lagena TaxID=94218 RepID=UPI0025422842|nr:uncharacterized protein N7510_005426 [Penicillium lagena]KAJ5612232.1 hypothetical protein N7510_005426 [Penicillium lagena]